MRKTIEKITPKIPLLNIEQRVRIDSAAFPVFESIWNKENEVDEKIVCDVCLSDEIDENEEDKIVVCDGCNNGVHQTCYG